MSYSNTRYPPDTPEDYPAPPTWLTWHEEVIGSWSGIKNTGQGPVRTHQNLKKAREYVLSRSRYDIEFRGAWRLYEWVDGAWVLRYSAEIGDVKDSHPLVKLKISAPRYRKPAAPSDIEKAIQSILSAMPTQEEALL